MSTVKVINVAKDFSRYPAGRYKDDGPFTGEHFREDLLIPSLHEYDKVVIELDGTRGYGSSFLEEAFGGLVRAGFDVELLKKKLHFSATDSSLIEEIEEYIEDAAKAQDCSPEP